MNLLPKKIKSHYEEVLASVKVIEVEEKFDLIFSRFFGLYLAKVSNNLNLTPNQLTLWSMIIGVVGGAFLFWQGDIVMIAVGFVLVTFAGLLDSADGQLARLSGKSSEFGRIIDGVADSFVFGACYIAGTLYYVVYFGDYYLIGLTLLAGYLQSFKTSVYDFYKSEAHYYLGDLESAKIDPPEKLQGRLKDMKGFWSRFFFKGYISYTRRQFWVCRTRPVLEELRKLYDQESTRSTFKELYKKKHIPLLKWWAFFSGLNTHRFGVLLFSFFAAYKLFIILSIVLTLPILLVLWFEKKADREILNTLSQK